MRKFLFTLILFGSLFWVNELSAATISPLRQAISLEPGAKESLTVKVGNDSDERKKFRADVKTFEVDKEGNITYSGNDKAENWLIYNKNPFILSPDQSKEVSFTVNVPNKAKPKSHYLVLFIREVGIDKEISTSAGIGSLFFLHVSGVRKESLEVINFSSSKKFYFQEPIELSLGLDNKGSIHLIPRGQVSLLKRGKKIANDKINKENDLILPNGNLNKEISFEGLSWRNTGKITAVSYLNYGRTDKTLSVKTEFWYIPWIIFKTIGIIFGITLLFILILKFYPRHKRK